MPGLRFGQYELAKNAVEDALRQFRTVSSSRGIGVGLLTRGYGIPYNGRCMARARNTSQRLPKITPTAQRPICAKSSRIFQTSVQEPIRAVQIRNEMACCYRARYQLLAYAHDADVNRNLAFDQAQSHFQYAISLAKKYNYVIEELDTICKILLCSAPGKKFDQAINYWIKSMSDPNTIIKSNPRWDWLNWIKTK